MRVGLIGFSGGGRTTLFTALSGLEPPPPAGNPLQHRPIAAVAVPDERLEWLRDLHQPKKFTPATVEFVDFAGIPRGEEKGKAELMAAIRDVDALLLVASAFDGAADAIEVEGPPLQRIRAIEEELLFADLEVVERRIERIEANLAKGLVKTKERDEKEIVIMRRCRELLEAGETLEAAARNRDEEELLSSYRFLRQKPRIAVINAADDADVASIESELAAGFDGAGLVIRGRLEAEIAQMPEGDRAEFMAEYGLDAPARDTLIASAFRATKSIVFFTVGEDECRAWVIREGDTALVAASKVHTDIARGFIRAEVTPYEDVRRHGSMKAAKAENCMRLEGKEYVVKDGEIVHFRFSV